MANSPYIPPSVSITEDVQVNVQPILERPTSIAIVGETLGYLPSTETVFLDDITSVTLKQSGIDSSTVVVVSALDPSATAYVAATDYVLSTADSFGNRTIKRNVYTTIPANTTLSVYYTRSAGAAITTTGSFPGFDPTIVTAAGGGTVSNGIDRFLTASSTGVGGTNPVSLVAPSGNITAVVIQSLGAFARSTDYTAARISSTSATVTRVGGSLQDGQVAYVTYRVASGTLYENEAVTFTGTAAQALAHQLEDVDANSVIVTNDPHGVASSYVDGSVPPNPATPIIAYTTGTSGAFDAITSALGSTTLKIDRNLNSAQGVALIGYQTNNIAVRVSYNATPSDYYAPTRFFNQSDVEAKYGVALDSDGNINSPASFGAYMAFLNLASDVVICPLFHVADPNVLNGTRTRPTPSTYTGDWALAFKALRDLEDVNVIVPVYARTANSGTINDSTVTTIFASLMSHINYMGNQQQYVIGIFGEDSTIAGNASQTALQAHARSVLGGSATPERACLISPGSFAFANPASGSQVRIGGQYAAAAISGMLSSKPIQTPLTRKSINGLTNVIDVRSESDKNADAGTGLMVIEVKNNVVRVRHSITVAVNNVNTRELSVVRAKNFMIESIKTTIDDQLIGQIIADQNAPFTVSTTVQSVLEALVADGVIVDYAGLQARSLAPTDPTKIEVRFSYKPAYPLNYVSVVFSIDTTSGAVDTTQANQNI